MGWEVTFIFGCWTTQSIYEKNNLWEVEVSSSNILINLIYYYFNIIIVIVCIFITVINSVKICVQKLFFSPKKGCVMTILRVNVFCYCLENLVLLLPRDKFPSMSTHISLGLLANYDERPLYIPWHFPALPKPCFALIIPKPVNKCRFQIYCSNTRNSKYTVDVFDGRIWFNKNIN